MKKISAILLVTSLLFLCSSCEKEDETGVGSMDLEVNLSLTLAEITWKRPVREVNIDVSYDIYLNNELLEANKLNPGYELEDLPLNSTFVFKVIGDIDGTIYTDEISFSTINPDDYNILLKSIGTIGVSTLQYNDNSKLIAVTKDPHEISLEYDNEGRLIKQSGTDFLFDGNRLTEISYVGNRFGSIQTSGAGPDFNEVRDFVFQNENTYTIEVFQGSTSSNTSNEYVRNVSLTRNGQGEIVTYKMFDEDGAIADNMEFSYANGNLIQLIDLIENKRYDITYDAKRSYHTFSVFYSESIMPERVAAGVIWTNSNLYKRFINIPELFMRQNRNNVLSVSVDGVPTSNYLYEYRGTDIPFTITYSNGITKELVYYIDEK